MSLVTINAENARAPLGWLFPPAGPQTIIDCQKVAIFRTGCKMDDVCSGFKTKGPGA